MRNIIYIIGAIVVIVLSCHSSAFGSTEPLFKPGDLVRMIRLVGSATHPAETFFEALAL
jgi:hypothetical protein